ncbi:MAG TPA: cysteine synthase A [Gemmatimonadaceae bacterium]|nr:cysteine synthase A [Gemmatimonadaceae bacterium]
MADGTQGQTVVVSDGVDAAIGRTPVVRLRRVVEPGMAEVWVKVEGMNPGGSIKDRTALGMIVDAERRGVLQPGGTIVEPTSGNTGIGLAQVASARGYRLILCLPSSMSEERKRTLLAYGAELVLTDPELRMIAAIAEAERIRDATGAWLPNQFANPANPRIHYETTGPELWRQMDGRIDAFVYGSGTGGTISGVGRYLKERAPAVQVVAVEPARSPVLSGGERGAHSFQGMGPGFVPANFDWTVVDRVVPAWEEDAFPLARRLAREEGLFVGMSSGAIVWVALQVARELGEGKRVACIAPDSGARYLTTVLFAPAPEAPPTAESGAAG